MPQTSSLFCKGTDKPSKSQILTLVDCQSELAGREIHYRKGLAQSR